ncbi:MAG: ferrochelatase [Saprospiraceae bacterium]|nr:ferrochelatase [Saprospiraceae bacterium]
MQNKAVLLVNLGSPDSTDPKDLKTYLGEFLMDEYVVDIPRPFRDLLVKGIILNTRPKKSAEAYARIWWDEGSPLIILSQQVQEKLQAKLDVPVGLGMRYGNPSIEHSIKELLKEVPNLEELFVIPLYPQYAEATTRTVMEKTLNVAKANNWAFNITFQEPFYDEETYLNALANSIKPYLNDWDYFLFSYHGVPVNHVKKTDPTKKHCQRVEDCCNKHNESAQKLCYRHHCVVTTNKVVEQLGLSKDQHSISFQSRLGPTKWLMPYTDKEIERLAHEGVKKLAIISPAFVSDCLETLEELGLEGKEEFLEAGGEDFIQIPCLNTNDEWVDTLVQYCNTFLNKFEPVQEI